MTLLTAVLLNFMTCQYLKPHTTVHFLLLALLLLLPMPYPQWTLAIILAHNILLTALLALHSNNLLAVTGYDLSAPTYTQRLPFRPYRPQKQY